MTKLQKYLFLREAIVNAANGNTRYADVLCELLEKKPPKTNEAFDKIVESAMERVL